MQLTPSTFFVTSGRATSQISDLNAFDVALYNARISEQNLVAVSSVIPVDARRVDICELPMGAVTHCVLSQMRGRDGESIAAGIAYAFRQDGKGGYVAEGHLHGSADSLKTELGRKMNEMARIRNVRFGDIHYVTTDLMIPADEYGCCVAALVFADYR
ncbi:MAG: pyruvoyl-dependent arginine decarboxylase [Methanomethylophilus sp.]|mgnify:CR=1 FL=1